MARRKPAHPAARKTCHDQGAPGARPRAGAVPGPAITAPCLKLARRPEGLTSILNLLPDPVGDLKAAADGQDFEFRQAGRTPVEQDVVPRSVIGMLGVPRCSAFLLVGPPAMPHDLAFASFSAAVPAGGS